MPLGIYFGNSDSICDSVLGLLVLLTIDVELVNKYLDIALVLDGQKARLEVLIEDPLLVYVSISLRLSYSSTD